MSGFTDGGARRQDTKQAVKDRLLRMAARGETTYRSDRPLPFYNATAWSATTAFTVGTIVNAGNNVYYCIKSGTTGSTAPSSKSTASITDGTVIWTYAGYLIPVAWAISLTIVADQIVYNQGRVFRAATAGTTAASGTGPTPASLTDNTVTWIYVGEQTLPLVTVNSSATSGLTQQASWNSPKITVLGATMVQRQSNNFGSLAAASVDGSFYDFTLHGASGSDGSIFTTTDAPVFEVQYFQSSSFLVIWYDGVVAGVIWQLGNPTVYLNVDRTGIAGSQGMHTIRLNMPVAVQFVGFNAKAVDTFAPYLPADTFRAVAIGDSFLNGTGSQIQTFSYAATLGRLLGIDDFRMSGQGGTGVLQTNGGIVNYTSRFTQDVINQNPNLVIIQCTGNDVSGIPASWTAATLKAALKALVLRVQAELPNAICVIMGVWNWRGALTGNYVTANTDAQAVAAETGVLFLDWSDLLTDGGFVGSSNTAGNSGIYTGYDDSHPSPAGHRYRAERVRAKMVALWSSMPTT